MNLAKLAKALRPKCLNCGERDAKWIAGLGTDAHIFCRSSCAAKYGARQAEERLLQWCTRCQTWHNEVSREQCSEEQKCILNDPRIPIV